MLILSQAKITMRPDSKAPAGRRIKIQGPVDHYQGRIKEFFAHLPAVRVTAALRSGEWHLRSDLDEFDEQRLRNFLVNSLPLRQS